MTNNLTAAAISLTLYSRSSCHLCEDMEAALGDLQQELGFQLERIDIDSAPELVQAYGTLVPVLKDGDTEICHYFLDPQALRDHLVI